MRTWRTMYIIYDVNIAHIVHLATMVSFTRHSRTELPPFLQTDRLQTAIRVCPAHVAGVAKTPLSSPRKQAGDCSESAPRVQSSGLRTPTTETPRSM